MDASVASCADGWPNTATLEMQKTWVWLTLGRTEVNFFYRPEGLESMQSDDQVELDKKGIFIVYLSLKFETCTYGQWKINWSWGMWRQWSVLWWVDRTCLTEVSIAGPWKANTYVSVWVALPTVPARWEVSKLKLEPWWGYCLSPGSKLENLLLTKALGWKITKPTHPWETEMPNLYIYISWWCWKIKFTYW